MDYDIFGGDDDYLDMGGPDLTAIIADALGGDADAMELIEDLGGDMDLLDILGGDEIGGRRRRRGFLAKLGRSKLLRKALPVLLPGVGTAMAKKMSSAHRSARRREQRAIAQRKALPFHDPKQPRALAQETNMSTVAATGGRKFLTPAGCTITISPIPVESRVPNGVGRHALRQTALSMPDRPFTAQVLGPGTANIAVPAPLATVEGTASKIEFFVIRVDIGLPGISVAAGNQVTFRVFTTQLLPAPVPGPEAVDNIQGVFDSGEITVTPFRNMEVCSLVMLPWRVVQAQPLPRVGRIDYGAISGGVFYQHDLQLQVIAAPANTSSVITMCNATHPTWQAVAKDLGYVGL